MYLLERIQVTLVVLMTKRQIGDIYIKQHMLQIRRQPYDRVIGRRWETLMSLVS